MSNMNQKLTEMRNGFEAVSQAVEAIAKQNPQAPDLSSVLDRSISGNKLQGGRIAQFSSAGIKDTASDFILKVTDKGISVDIAHIKKIPNELHVDGHLNVNGIINAKKINVDEVVADIRNETTSNLEFKAENNSVSNKGLIWSGEGLQEVGKRPDTGEVIIRIDQRYFRPTEVDTLLGDAENARKKLGWSPKISLKELIGEMIQYDLNEAKKERILNEKGFNIVSPMN